MNDAAADVMGIPDSGRPKKTDIVSGLFPNSKLVDAPGLLGADGKPAMNEHQMEKIKKEHAKSPPQKFRVEGDLNYDPENKCAVWVTHIWWKSPKTGKMTRVLDLPIATSGLENILEQMKAFEKEVKEKNKEVEEK